MVLGANLAMLMAEIGESAKKYSLWREWHEDDPWRFTLPGRFASRLGGGRTRERAPLGASLSMQAALFWLTAADDATTAAPLTLLISARADQPLGNY